MSNKNASENEMTWAFIPSFAYVFTEFAYHYMAHVSIFLKSVFMYFYSQSVKYNSKGNENWRKML